MPTPPSEQRRNGILAIAGFFAFYGVVCTVVADNRDCEDEAAPEAAEPVRVWATIPSAERSPFDDFVTWQPGAFSLDGGVLRVLGRGELWTRDEAYDLRGGATAIVEARARLSALPHHEVRAGELLIGFSANRAPWKGGRGDEDALTIRIHSHTDWPTAVRGRLFADFFATSQYRAPIGRWLDVRVELSRERVVVLVDGEEAISASLAGRTFPLAGHVGVLGFGAGGVEVASLRVAR